jgi:hypothetical protein
MWNFHDMLHSFESAGVLNTSGARRAFQEFARDSIKGEKYEK